MTYWNERRNPMSVLPPDDPVIGRLDKIAGLLETSITSADSIADRVEAAVAREREDRQTAAKAAADRTDKQIKWTRILVAAVLLLGVVGVGVGRRYTESRTLSCSARTAARGDVRAAILAAVDETALYAEVDAAGRVELTERVAERVRTEYPDPDC